MRRTWVKLYVDQCLRGSMIAELNPTQRWMFVGLILMAGDSPIPGIVYRRKDENGVPVGYSDIILADTLGVEVEDVQPGLARMVEKSKVSVNPNGVISVCNWNKYQSEYERTRNAPSRVVQKYGVDVDVDVERDVDVEKKDGIDFDAHSRRWTNIQPSDLEAWAKAYPACDVSTELAKAGEWIIANPAKGKKSNYRRFIVNWLARQQDRGGTGGASGRPAVDMRVGAKRPGDKMDPDYAAARAAKLTELNKVGGDPAYIKEALAAFSREWWESREHSAGRGE